uniref:Uncharacterized protein n=1 Tax=Romanomermis culicivorax TaxID=13658 RepID=A0A915IXV4_ROMCU
MLTAGELLEGPTSAQDVEPVDEELLDMPIFDLNMAKLLPPIDVSSPPTLIIPANFTVRTTQINQFLKLRLDNISILTPILMDESTPVQPTVMDAETNTATMDQMLTDIPEETTANQSMAMDVTPQEPINRIGGPSHLFSYPRGLNGKPCPPL